MPPILPQQGNAFFPGAQKPIPTVPGLPASMPAQAPFYPGMQKPAPQGYPKQQQPQLPKTLPFKKAYYKTLQKGSLVSFNYDYWRHDKTPLAIITDVSGDRIRGVNLHYLTFRYIKQVLQNYCGKPDFSYRYIKHDKFIVNAFRTYKKAGIRQLKILDCEVINTALKTVRSFNPQEMNFIRQTIQQQLQAQLNPTAQQLAQQFQQQMLQPQPQQGFMPLQPAKQQDGRRAFTPQTQQQLNQDLTNWQQQRGVTPNQNLQQ